MLPVQGTHGCCHRGLCLAVDKRKSDYALWRHWVFNYTYTANLNTCGIIWFPFRHLFQAFLLFEPNLYLQFLSLACEAKKPGRIECRHRQLNLWLSFFNVSVSINSLHGITVKILWPGDDAEKRRSPCERCQAAKRKWMRKCVGKGGEHFSIGTGRKKIGIKRFKLWSFHRLPNAPGSSFEL